MHRGAGANETNALPEEIIEAAPSLDTDLQQFWGEPSANLVRAMPVRGELPFSLRQLGKPPGNIAGDLRDIYAVVAQEALRWLGFDDE